MLLFGVMLVAGALALFFTPISGPLAAAVAIFLPDRHFRRRHAPRFARNDRFGRPMPHPWVDDLVIWSVGHAQGLALPVLDCAVLFYLELADLDVAQYNSTDGAVDARFADPPQHCP